MGFLSTRGGERGGSECVLSGEGGEGKGGDLSHPHFCFRFCHQTALCVKQSAPDSSLDMFPFLFSPSTDTFGCVRIHAILRGVFSSVKIAVV